MEAPKIPEPAASTPLKDLPAAGVHGLSLQCGCGATVLYPVRALIEGHPDLARTPLRAVVARLKCKRCGAPPASIELMPEWPPPNDMKVRG